MRKQLIALAAIAATLAPQFASAQDSGDWIVRGRALHLKSDNGGSTSVVGLSGAGVPEGTDLKLKTNDKTFAELDISYFFSPNLATELILTYPQYQKLESETLGTKIGSFRHLPPTLTAQYHFTNVPGVRPYVGAGVNYTRITGIHFDKSLPVGSVTLGDASPKVSRNSFGWALQAGADIPVGGGWLLNLDVKKVKIGVDVELLGKKVGEFNVDPYLYSVGFGKRF